MLNHNIMAPPADMHTSSDVFGNELGDVDVWGDVKTSDDDSNEGPPARGTNKAFDKALRIIDGRPPAPPSSPHKPPRTSSKCSRKTMIVKPPLTRSPGSGSDDFEGTLAFKQAHDSGKVLPPMTPRTRIRKIGLQLSSSSIVSASSCEEEAPVSRPMGAAEKRRLRHECLSLRTKNMEQGNEDASLPKMGGNAFELSSTHTRITAQMDSSLSSLSLCPSHFTSVSKGSHGDLECSMELKDLCQSQVSFGSSNWRNKSSRTEMEFSALHLEPKRNRVDDLARHIETALQRCSDAKPSKLKRGRRYNSDSVVETFSKGISPPPRPVSSPRTPRSSRKSPAKQGGNLTDCCASRTDCDYKLLSVGSDIRECDDDSKSRWSTNSALSHSVRRRSSSQPKGPASTKGNGAQPNVPYSNKPTDSQPRLPTRSRSDCQTPATRTRKLPSQATLPRRSVSDAFERRLVPLSTQRSPSPCVRCKSSIELKGHTRRRSSTPRRTIKQGIEIDLQNSLSISKLEF